MEQAIGRTIMPRFHAGFSIGTVAGALGGAGCVASDISVTAHLLVVAALNLAVVPIACCEASAATTTAPEASDEAPASHPRTR